METDSILIFQKIVPAYRVPVFKLLYEKYGIVVCHSLERKNASWKSALPQMDYPNILLPRFYYSRTESSVIQKILPTLKKYRPKIVITEFSLAYLTGWYLLFLKIFFKYKLAVWTHGVNNKDMLHPFNSLKSKLMLLLYRRVDAVLLYSNERRKLIANKISDPQKLFVAYNTLDTSQFNISSYSGNDSSCDELKRSIGFKNRHNLIFVGRLLNSKRIDLLLAAFELLADKFDVGLHFIGDGPEIEIIRRHQNRFASIYTHGAIFDETALGNFLQAADLMIMPGYVGLSIIHAFAYGTPMITCKMTENGPFHSPEIEYLQDGFNGVMCNSSASSLAEAIADLLSNEAKLKGMSLNAYDTISKYCSIEKMIKGFDDLIGYLNKKKD